MGQFVDASLDVAESGLPKLNTHIQEVLSGARVLCLSAISDSIPMWTYYAANHEGLVLTFRRVDKGGILEWAEPMNYERVVPSILDTEQMSEYLAGFGELDKEDIFRAAIYTKYAAWEHEQEYRVLSGRRGLVAPYEDVAFGAGELAAITFGVRASAELRRSVTALAQAKYPAAALNEAYVVRDIYAVRFRQCQDVNSPT